MKKELISLGLCCIIIVILFCGCTQQDNNGDSTNGKTVTMTVKELSDDMAPPENLLSLTILYNSLENRDTLILQDTIPEITYVSDTQSTNIRYEWTEEQGGGTLTKSWTLRVDGDITDEFQVGDEFKLTVTIKHVAISNPLGEGEIELEIFEEEWVSEDYFIENLVTGGLKPLPQSCIEKI